MFVIKKLRATRQPENTEFCLCDERSEEAIQKKHDNRRKNDRIVSRHAALAVAKTGACEL